jgi:L,D-transpeptidase catalytic domain
MKVFLSLFITISLISGINLLANKQAAAIREGTSGNPATTGSRVKLNEEKLKTFAASAKDFVRQKKYNPDYCFLIDMSLASGQPRFFIYDLAKDSIRQSGLVAHGNCYQDWLEGRKYSNKVGSGCTSLGRYRIGNPYTGMWGYSYKLHGLDSSNNNAFERTVVLHGHRCVPSEAVEEEICQSNGCPTVSPDFLVRLKQLINSSAKPVLLWIYQ